MFNQNIDQSEIRVENAVAKYLGPQSDGKLKVIEFDGENERIGNFSSIRKYADEIDKDSKDYTVSWDDVVFGNLLDPSKINNLCIYPTDDYGVMNFSTHGLNSMCTQLDVPTTYLRKCIEKEEIDHAANVMNFWTMKKPKDKQILLRSTKDRIHGALSTKYTVFDDHEVLAITEDIIGHLGDYTVKNYYLSPEYMKLRVVGREKIEINGRPLSFAFDIKNSRVGRSSLGVNVLVYDWICSNGIIFGGGMGEFFKKRHVGISREVFIHEFAEIINKAPDTIKYIQKAAEAAHREKLSSESIQRYLDKFKAENMPKHAEVLIKDRLEDGTAYQKTAYGLIGAMTEVAQRYDIDTRERMEKFAGNILASVTKTA